MLQPCAFSLTRVNLILSLHIANLHRPGSIGQLPQPIDVRESLNASNLVEDLGESL